MKDKEKPAKQLARAYIPNQTYNERWQPMEGLKRGTIFPELYRPYEKMDHG
ncbi:MAG: spore coat associated protein CotJA [Firmicutes bacterium]|nr:spore coat associated protein CotJA [Bacillota bacterium]